MARIVETHGPRVPLCCDCKHAGENGYCEKTEISQRFSRQSRERFACGPWGDLYEGVPQKEALTEIARLDVENGFI